MSVRVKSWLHICVALLLLFLHVSVAFYSVGTSSATSSRTHLFRLFMGRAANVRAATKSKTDAAKAKKNNRYAKKIIQAVKAGGSDAASNKQLEMVIKESKMNDVPNDVIERNIKKAGEVNQADFSESVFEYYGHGGVGMIINVLTDKATRAASDIQLVAKKHNLKDASKNSVVFNFERKARLDVALPEKEKGNNKLDPPPMLTEDILLEVCLECGVDEYEINVDPNGSQFAPEEEGKQVVYVAMSDMVALRDALSAARYKVTNTLQYIPTAGVVDINDEDFEKNMAAIDAFNELDDVDSVETNINMIG